MAGWKNLPLVSNPSHAVGSSGDAKAAKHLSRIFLRLHQSHRSLMAAARMLATDFPVLAERLTRMSRARHDAAAELAELAVQEGLGWESRRNVAGRIHQTWLRLTGRIGPAALLDQCARFDRRARRALDRYADQSRIPLALQSRLTEMSTDIERDLDWMTSHRMAYDSPLADRDGPATQPDPPMPEFRAPASTGQTLTSERYRGKLALVIFFLPDVGSRRSGRRIAEFNRRLGSFGRLRTQLLGVIPETARRVRREAELKGYNLPLLSDPDESIQRAFGLQPVADPPWPTFIIDSRGHIVRTVYGTGRPGHVTQVLAHLEQLRTELDTMEPVLNNHSTLAVDSPAADVV